MICLFKENNYVIISVARNIFLESRDKMKLYVRDFGKIKEANIDVKPLTLFVGDNNSGKSYLLSLIWALRSRECLRFLFSKISNYKDMDFYKRIENTFSEEIINRKKSKFYLNINQNDMIMFLNKLLDRYRDDFIKNVFNFKEINIGELRLDFAPNKINVCAIVNYDSDGNVAQMSVEIHKYGGFAFYSKFNNNLHDFPLDFIVKETIVIYIERLLGVTGNFRNVYLPSARTGFMLSKDILNKYGREKAFGGVVFFDKDDETSESPKLFTRPILHFLDMMTVERQEGVDKKDIVEFIEERMTNGIVDYLNEETKEYGYTPRGHGSMLPLRAVSAVVTEMAPLILVLKNIRVLDYICYEEPEMCLHPQLQLQMGRVLVKLVNSGIQIVATTHSDIILQHINNMCALNSFTEEDKKKAFEQFKHTTDDILDFSKVAVYQFRDNGTYSNVDKISPTKFGFNVPTFTSALEKILEQSLVINQGEGVCSD